MIREELYIPIERPQRNFVNGQFLKGHVPHCKGKKWDEWISKRKQAKLRKILREKCPHTGNPNLGGWNRKTIYALDEESNIIGIFSSSYDAEKKTGIKSRYIRNACQGIRQKRAGGYRWVYEENYILNK